MGRTIPPYRIILEEELKRWGRFREALRIDKREVFQDMMDECRRHASAAGAACIPSKSEAMFLSLLFAHHRSLSELHDKLDRVSAFLGQSVGKAEERTQNPDQKEKYALAGN